MQHVFIVGAKSLGTYGGYETFVNKLTEYHQYDKNIKYHVACKANGDGCMEEAKTEGTEKINETEFAYHNARCFKIRVPSIGPAQAIYYDIASLKNCCSYIEKNEVLNPIVYILACRIGPFAKHFYKTVHRLGGMIYLNPDGHEWMRAKWSFPVRKYWKLSEKLMIKYCDLVICDSITIEKYVHTSYDGKGIKSRRPKTKYIAYGADSNSSMLTDRDSLFTEWLERNQVSIMNYYLVVGRFVPENNYEIMIREFMKSESKRDFVIVTNVNTKFLSQLEKRLHFQQDVRIKFVGTVYNQELLKKIRENAYAYLHGHEVGGTNPSLLEALSSTNLNLLLDVGFNREVAKDAALYWNKFDGNLANLIRISDDMTEEEINKHAQLAKKRIEDAYSWQYIANEYKEVFQGSKTSYEIFC